MILTQPTSEDNPFAPATPVQTNPTLLYVGGHIVGAITGDTFYKSFGGSKQILRTPPAIVLDPASLYQARQVGATRVEVFDSETGDVYQASLDTLLRNGKIVDYGAGRQVALPLALFAEA